ncbi:MAG TPA: hypothetical protein VK427_24160, partial [Kofleriaceae bacterium]|nr:hypothetical protein [Kofleriaceae bacterium]
MRGIAAIVIGLMFTACAFDPAREKRPARLLLGANARGLAGSTASNIAARGEVAAPTSTPEVASGAITGSGQFTMRYGRVLRLGIELEEGRLDTAGSNYAGAYGVVR